VLDSVVDESALRRAIADAVDAVVISTDADATITSWNPAAERLYGYKERDILGQSFTALVPPALRAEELEFRKRVLTGETIRDIVTTQRSADGSDVTVLLSLSPILLDGQVIGVLRIARDGTHREQSERAARRLAAIVESSDDAIVGKDLNGVVTSWNRAAEKMFGYSPEEMIGRSIRTIIPDELQHEEDEVLARIRRGERVEHFETVRRRKDGGRVNISLTVSPILDLTGRVIGASKIVRDISDRKQADVERQKLHEVGSIVSATLDRSTILQTVTDIATDLTEAQFGAFYYNIANEQGESFQLYTISGMPREAFAKFAMPRNSEVFGPTGTAVVRSADITADPRYDKNPPHHGAPQGQLPVRSYLAVPVKSPSREVFGGLFFGHSETGKFTERHERLALGVASWASVALENARLYVGVQEANRLKDEFLATLSHELRTPLNAILGYARMMRMGILAPRKQTHAVETIERNATALTQIVEDVLDVSRIVSGKMRLAVQSIDLIAIARQSLEAVRPAAEAKHIVVETAFDVDVLSISADPDRLQQVLWNLMSNAVKFTGSGGRVTMAVTRNDATIEITVTDSGVGIAPAFLPHVFERFRQAESGTNRERGGLGLGLAISRELIEMHGGTIRAESPGVGLGSTFRIVLPTTITRLTQQTADRAVAADDVVSVSVANLVGLRILAVDDDADALSLVREILENAGAEMMVATSAAEALEILNRETPDAIVSDIAMPRTDGFELIAQIRHHPQAEVRAIPAAALTAYARSEDSVRARRSGFQLHLSKPIDPVALTIAVASLVGRSAS
jgi:PAS domain S-box-containing protein